jgi:hypothetical protein
MKTPSLKTLIRVLGIALSLITCVSLLFCVALVFSATDKVYNVSQSLGYWPLFSLFLLLISVYLIAGAPHLVRLIERRRGEMTKRIMPPNKSLEPTAAPLLGLARLPFRAAGSSGCGSAFIR